MKGTPAEPQCGFSRAVIVLSVHGVAVGKMRAFDVLADDELRSSIKECSLVSRTRLQFLKYTSIDNLLVNAILF